jgi:hypothetical protein
MILCCFVGILTGGAHHFENIMVPVPMLLVVLEFLCDVCLVVPFTDPIFILLSFYFKLSCEKKNILDNLVALFCFSYFSDSVSHFCLASLDLDLPTYASCVAGITGENHHPWLRTSI